jgi:D-alanyl-D-alanine carboxypeptidase
MAVHAGKLLELSRSTSRTSGHLWKFARAVALLVIGVSGQTAIADEVGRYIEQERKIYGLPAVVLGVIRDGKLIDARAIGSANVELNVKARPQHAFEVGSISKQFTAYAILVLRDRGKLDLGAPVGRYLTDLPDDWAKVTLHRLLTHTSGLPDIEEAFGYGIYRDTPTDTEFLRRLAALPIEFQPGEKWHYSNTNYWLLALVIEKLTGLSYSEFMQRNIFTPLGMTSTRSALPSKVLAGRASGYRRVGPVLENRDAIQPNTGRGLGDITTTVADMARWEREQLAPRLLSPATAALARQPVSLNNGKKEPYGYGWSTEKILPMVSLQHDGQTAGFSASYIRVPERRLAVVVFSNCYAAPTESIGKFVLRRAEPALRTPRPGAIPDIAPQITLRVGNLLSSAPSAQTEWREEWFSPDYWRSIKPWLSEVAEFYRRLGEPRSLTLVGRDQQEDATTLTYRVVYPNLSRLVMLRFDAQGRIGSRDAVDE